MQSLTLESLNELAKTRAKLLARRDAIPAEIAVFLQEPVSDSAALGIQLRKTETELIETMLETNSIRLQLCCLELGREEREEAEKNAAPSITESAAHATTLFPRGD